MLNFYIFNVKSINIAVFGNKDIDTYRLFFKSISSDYEECDVKKNTVFYSLLNTLKDCLVILKTVNNTKDFFKILFYSYKLERSNCHTIISSLFYSPTFHCLSIAKKNKRFIAISVAYGHYENEVKLYGINWKSFKLQNIELLLQGEWQKNYIKNKCFNTGKISVTGGLNNALYVSRRSDTRAQYDICIISNFKESYGNSKANADFYSTLRKVCTEIGLTICVAGRYPEDDLIGSEKEYRYFKESLGAGILYLPRNGYSTYELSDKSHVSVGDLTTSLVESFGRGRKIMACNPSLLRELNFPINGIWTLSSFDYDSVKTSISKILSIKKSEWSSLTNNARESLSHNGKSNTAIKTIENIIFGNG